MACGPSEREVFRLVVLVYPCSQDTTRNVATDILTQRIRYQDRHAKFDSLGGLSLEQSWLA